MLGLSSGPPPAPAPDYPGAGSPDGRAGRSRTADRAGPRGPVRRIQSSGPGGGPDRRVLTCGGHRPARRPDSGELTREVEELRARTQQMEKTLRCETTVWLSQPMFGSFYFTF